MASVSVVPIRQDTMQSLPVSVWYLSERTQCSHFQCQCGTYQTGHNIVTSSVNVVPVRQDTMLSRSVSVWVCQLGHNAVTFHSQTHTECLAVATLCCHNIPLVSLIQNSHFVPVSILMQILRSFQFPNP